MKGPIIVIYNDDLKIKRGLSDDIISFNAVIKASEDVERTLKDSGFETLRIGLNSDRLIDTIKKLGESKPQIIFNLCEGFDGDPSQEKNVAALFELLDLHYTGSPSSIIGLTSDKWKTKQLLLQNSIPAPKGTGINQISNIKSQISNLKFPLMVKPLSEDGSIGIERDSVVSDRHALKRKIEFILDTYNQPAMVEEYIDGREFDVSIIGNSKPFILPISEIDYSRISPDTPKILCYTSKWMKDSDIYRLTPSVCPADIPDDIEKDIKGTALKAFEITGCRDYARVDIRLSKDNVPYVLEVNANPDISVDAGMAKSAKAAGWSYRDLIKNILNAAMERA
ncbi:MAG: ATP-grasp domain-containing protein [Nitrospinae bacterium]|nr:ATP-grasp domain-containing protein [Nitrospinota bacterium]